MSDAELDDLGLFNSQILLCFSVSILSIEFRTVREFRALKMTPYLKIPIILQLIKRISKRF